MVDNFESNIKSIKKLVSVISGRDVDVTVTYKGNSYGVTKCWNIKCDNRELNHENYQLCAEELVLSLKKELLEKINSAEQQAANYRSILGELSN
jgi:hypothetical protein